MMKTALILSPHFPPSTLAGVHRARHLAKHLPAHGWRPVIVRADPAHYTEAGDSALAALVPTTVEQVATKAWPVSITRQFGVGDIGIRGYPYFARSLKQAAATHQPSAVLITGSPFIPMLLGRMVRQSLRVPVILDFQDPWISAEGATRPLLSKGRMAHRLACALEPIAVRHASYITSVSETQNDQMAARYPWLDRARMAAIPIGGDPEDFDELRRHPPQKPTVRLASDKLNFCYVGTFLPRAGPIVRTLFKAVAQLRSSNPELGARMRFVFVGTSNQPGAAGAKATHCVTPIAREAGIADMVVETPERVPFIEALALQANAHVILMLGSDEPHYTASKIYPGMMSGRPFLSIFHQASSAHQILSASGGGAAFSFETLAELEAVKAKVTEALRELTQAPEKFPAIPPSAYARYSAHAVAGRFAGILDQLGHAPLQTRKRSL